VADIPDSIVLKRDRDLEGRGWHLWVRRGLLALVAALSIAAFANVFGQTSDTASASAPGVQLRLKAPTSLRGGLLWQAQFRIDATRELKDARLVLGKNWAAGQTINTIEPSPIGEASSNGDLSFDLGHVRAGSRYILYMDFQTNPTTFGTRPRTTTLYDGQTRLLSIDQSVTVYP
jgi:hypothetical protein